MSALEMTDENGVVHSSIVDIGMLFSKHLDKLQNFCHAYGWPCKIEIEEGKVDIKIRLK